MRHVGRGSDARHVGRGAMRCGGGGGGVLSQGGDADVATGSQEYYGIYINLNTIFIHEISNY